MSEVYPPTIHQQEALFPESEVPYFHGYDVLVSDNPSETNEELREKYARYTDSLIHTIQKEKPEFLIFLDKSARPVAWMMKELWPIMATNENGSVEEMPDIKFLNIDREQWSHLVKNEDSGAIDATRLEPSIFSNLRGVFTEKNVPEQQKDTMTERTIFDGTKVMIIDEVRISGDTLDIAAEILKGAFPSAEFVKTHWMKPELARKGGDLALPIEQPVWYRADINTGRGIGNRDNNKSANSASSRQRRGKLFLGTPLPSKDSKSEQLRAEIKHMVSDIKEGRLVIIPDTTRDDFEQQFNRINSITLDEFMANRE